jgi:pyruvate/2-oxoglutarate dehydrogenase complex dihydrolipoamide dehydrogenase (E3) component
LRIRVGRADLAASPRGWLHGRGNAGLVKVVEDAGSGVLVGATVAGPRAGELLGQLTLAVHARVPSASLETMIYAFPTFYETVKQALQDLH